MPVVTGLLPIYLFAQAAGLLDNVWLLSVLYTSVNLPIAVWMMRSLLAEVRSGGRRWPEQRGPARSLQDRSY